LLNLQPGSYTAVAAGKGGTTGIGLLETFELDGSTSSQLTNASSRALAQTGDDVIICGLTITAQNGSLPVLLRVLGPSLSQFGIAGTLGDPILELRDSNGQLVAANNDWEQTQRAAIRATGLAPFDSKESAILMNLAAGPYTAIVRDANGGSGTALFEAYNLRLPPPSLLFR
jgi:hypothetical protein